MLHVQTKSLRFGWSLNIKELLVYCKIGCTLHFQKYNIHNYAIQCIIYNLVWIYTYIICNTECGLINLWCSVTLWSNVYPEPHKTTLLICSASAIQVKFNWFLGVSRCAGRQRLYFNCFSRCVISKSFSHNGPYACSSHQHLSISRISKA